MLKRIVASAAVLVAGAGVLALPTPAADAAGGSHASHSLTLVQPYEGTYMGSTVSGHRITFELKGHKILHLHVATYHSLGSPTFHGHYWNKTCHLGLCSEGHWSDDVTVEGKFFDHKGVPSHFTARLFAH